MGENPNEDVFAIKTTELRICALHLTAISGFIDDMERSGMNVATWKRSLSNWTLGLFLYPHGWGNPQGSSLDNYELDLLSAFADLLDYRVPSISPTGVSDVYDFVADIEKTAGEKPIDPALKRHLSNVTMHIRWCLDNFTEVGEFELEKALVNLAAVVNLLDFSEKQRSGEESRFRRFMDDWVNPFTVSTLAGLSSNVATTGLLAITS